MPKSLSVERTFREDITDFAKVRAEAVEAARELTSRVKEGGFRFRVAGMKIRFHGFETHTREKTLTGYTDSEDVLREVVMGLLDEFEARTDRIRLVGVRVASLERDSSAPSALDPWT